MKRPAALDFREMVEVTTLAAGCALAMGLVLSALASPSHYKDRLAMLEAQTVQARDLFRTMHGSDLADPAAVCARDAAAEAQAMHDQITAYAGQSNLTLEALDSRPETSSETATKLAPVRLKFQATGSYESAIALLAMLSRQRPQLFADNVDLTSKTSNVTLNFSGRVFCSG